LGIPDCLVIIGLEPAVFDNLLPRYHNDKCRAACRERRRSRYDVFNDDKELTDIDTTPRPWYRGPYFILSAILMVVTIAFPLISSTLDAYLLKVTLTLLLFGALYAVVADRKIFRILGVLLLPLIVGNWLYDPAEQGLWAQTTATLTLLFLLTTTIVIFATIITATRVSTDIIFGAVAVYMLVGVIVAVLFQLLHNADPGSVVTHMDSISHDLFPQFLYFSFVTLTSVGYGDFAPASPEARTLATATGIFGQLYLAILIAKLVGVYTAQSITETRQ